MSRIQKAKLIEHYKSSLAKMIDDTDISRYFGDGKIVKYNELKNYSTINDLLPEPTDFRIILLESKPNVGHWVCVMKYKDILEFWDSYGVNPKGEFKYISKIMNKLLGQNENELYDLMAKTKHPHQKCYYNKRRFQSNNDGINTCGRWCIARILAMRIGYELDDFINKVDEKCEETGKPPDILVCDWIK